MQPIQHICLSLACAFHPTPCVWTMSDKSHFCCKLQYSIDYIHGHLCMGVIIPYFWIQLIWLFGQWKASSWLLVSAQAGIFNHLWISVYIGLIYEFHVQLLGWLVAAPIILGGLYILCLPCFKILVYKFSAASSSPKKQSGSPKIQPSSITSPRMSFSSPPGEVRLKVRDAWRLKTCTYSTSYQCTVKLYPIL